MDLGIRGETALVVGANGGVAVADAFAQLFADVGAAAAPGGAGVAVGLVQHVGGHVGRQVVDVGQQVLHHVVSAGGGQRQACASSALPGK